VGVRLLITRFGGESPNQTPHPRWQRLTILHAGIPEEPVNPCANTFYLSIRNKRYNAALRRRGALQVSSAMEPDTGSARISFFNRARPNETERNA
jgi:hypothetical protein